MATLKKSFGLFVIGLLVGIANFLFEYAEEVVIEENQDFELKSFLTDFLDGTNVFFLLIFIISAPLSIYLSYKSQGRISTLIGYIVLVVTGFGWWGIMIMLIENAIGNA